MAQNHSRATESDLADLHGQFAQFLSSKLKIGEVTAADLSVIRQFLKDNGIDCVPGHNQNVNDLVNNLPTYDEDEANGQVFLQ